METEQRGRLISGPSLTQQCPARQFPQGWRSAFPPPPSADPGSWILHENRVQFLTPQVREDWRRASLTCCRKFMRLSTTPPTGGTGVGEAEAGRAEQLRRSGVQAHLCPT